MTGDRLTLWSLGGEPLDRRPLRFTALDDGKSRFVLDDEDRRRALASLAETGCAPGDDRISAYLPIWGDHPWCDGGAAPPAEVVDPRRSQLRALGETITSPDGDAPPDAPNMPAAYTYIGQLIAHDLSDFRLDLEGAVNLRTPALDLDSVFRCRKLTERFVSNVSYPGNLIGGVSERDIPRHHGGRPDIADLRNDQNVGVSQVHAMLGAFFEREKAGMSPEAAHLSTKWHFQQAVLDDYLPRLTGREAVEALTRPNAQRLVSLEPPFLLPLEFALAFFRFGHAQVRDSYRWGRDQTTAFTPKLLAFSGAGCSLADGAGPWLPRQWALHWPDMIGPGATVMARSLGARLAPGHARHGADISCDPMEPYPCSDRPQSDMHPCEGRPDEACRDMSLRINLAAETLIRGETYGLPSAQRLLAWVNRAGSEKEPVEQAELASPASRKHALRFASPTLAALMDEDLWRETPLWLYMLLEARRCSGGRQLGPLAGRVVAETLVAAIVADPDGVLDAAGRPRWTPSSVDPARNGGRWTFADMARHAFPEINIAEGDDPWLR